MTILLWDKNYNSYNLLSYSHNQFKKCWMTITICARKFNFSTKEVVCHLIPETNSDAKKNSSQNEHPISFRTGTQGSSGNKKGGSH